MFDYALVRGYKYSHNCMYIFSIITNIIVIIFICTIIRVLIKGIITFIRVLVFFKVKYLNSENYVEVKDHRYKVHPTENILIRSRDPPKSLRTKYQVRNETQIRRNQKVIKNNNNELVVKNYPKNKQPIIQQLKFTLPIYPSCKQNIWLEFNKGY